MSTILVVDDELGYRDLLHTELAVHGYNVLSAADGVEALEILKKEKVDLVITDIRMPRMDGIDTLFAIRQSFPRLPVILMTGYAVGDKAERTVELRIATCLKKPFDTGELADIVKAHLGRS